MSNYIIKDMPISERPREKLKEVGVENLTNVELLAILLKSGLPNKNVVDVSLDLLNRYSFNNLSNLSLEDLRKINGIGEVKAIELVASIELGKRIFLKPNVEYKKMDSVEKIWRDSKYLFYGKKQECFYCYYLNNKQKLIEKKLIFMGTINSSVTHIREVFKEAYRVSASYIVCLHNHPSGDVTPSKADISFTNSLIKTGNIQGIPVIDHIIVGDNIYYSFYEKEQIKDEN